MSKKTLTTDTSQQIAFQKASQRLKRVDAFMLTSLRTGVQDYWNMAHNKLSSFEFQIGGDSLTSKPVSTSYGDSAGDHGLYNHKLAEATLHSIRSRKMAGEPLYSYGDSGMGIANIGVDRFVMSHRLDLSLDDTEISSADVAEQNIDLNLEFSSNPLGGSLYLYKTEDRRMNILTASQFRMVL